MQSRPRPADLTVRLFFFLPFLFLFLNASSQTGTITGKITNGQSKENLSNAVVSLTNSKYKKFTNNSGEFTLANVPANEYELTVEYVGFTTYTQRVHLKANETLRLDIAVIPNGKSLEQVTVFGRLSQETEAGARQREQYANNIVNVVSARAMERSPDINAANVLQRMSGLTIQRSGGGDQAFPIVRGLDPNYSNTLVNGVKITSPDDKSRFVPLNVVPSDLLGSIEVHKTLLPEMEGDAIGGSVNLLMKDAPEKQVFKVLASVGYSKIFMDRPFLTFSKKDIQQKSLIEKYGSSYIAQPNDFSRTNLDFKETTAWPNVVAGIVFGQRFFRNKLGFMIANNFQNQYYGSNSIFNQVAPDVHAGGAAIVSDYANRYFSTQELNNGLTLHLDYQFNEKNKILLTNIFLYTSLSQARNIIDTSILGGNGGRTVPGTGPVSTDFTSVTSKQIIQNLKLEGKHILSNHFLLDWAGVWSYAAKRTPDFANLAINSKIDTMHTTHDINGPYVFVKTPNYFDQITRIWQHNEDMDLDGILNLAYRQKIASNGSFEFKIGGLYRHKSRSNIQDEYDLKPTTSSSGIKQQFNDIYSAQWLVYNSSGTYDYDKNKYKLHENVAAGYGQFRIAFPIIEVAGGLRVENTQQGYQLFTFYATGINGVDKSYTDFLPSIDIKFKPNSLTNIRASYYKAIARPNFYDLVPAERISTTTANSTTGNPYLKHTVADNFDLRYEYFPREEDQAFAGVFYKKLMDPIEYAYVNGTKIQPVNYGDATDYGLELGWTHYFGKIGITGNYTYIYSKIYSIKSYYDLNTGYINTDTLQKRSLQGQTNHVLNVSLLYKSIPKKFFAELAFQYLGKSIALVYPIFGYDYYQQPQYNLAFSAEKELKNHFTLFTKINNILNTPVKNEINNLLVVNDITKFNFSIGFRYQR
ncbi:MAG: hypothetical protein C5B59_09350 [Bacteroidetes bacterium]|nr:MAG: hypothetical protein C5B59_09350 [Bacteroidota bacterium]